MTKPPEEKIPDASAPDLIAWLGFTNTPNWSKARTLGGIAGMILSLFFLAAFVAAASVLFGTIRDVFAGTPTGPNLGAGALITALLGAPFLIWSTVIKHKSLGFQKEGHLTDRISKAVEQLGAEKTVKRADSEVTLPNIEVRIGGILSLERIAQDSTAYDHGRDHVRCMEILCAYIRENAPASGAKDHVFGEWEPLKDDPTAEERAAHLEKRKARFGGYHFESQVYQWARKLPEPRADIALALRVLGRRTAAQRQAEARWGKDASPDAEWVFDVPCPSLPDTADDRATTFDELASYQPKLQEWKTKIYAYAGYRLDLRKTNLQGADLSDLIVSGAKLQEARIEGANLFRVRMEGANLSHARLEAANLWQARLEGADLWKAWMEGAGLSEVRMQGAELVEVRLEGANLGEARMEGAELVEAGMEGVRLWRARMEGANLFQARMEGAGFWLARMEGADLSEARIEGASLYEARLEGAILDDTSLLGAALREMDCSRMEFSPDQITSTFGDASVILPKGVTPQSRDWPAHWPKHELRLGSFNTEWRKWQASPDTYTPPDPPK